MRPFACALLCGVAAAAPNVSLLVHAHDARTWYGSAAIGLLGPSDPVLLTSTWVYAPEEIVAYRPSVSATNASWRLDTSKDGRYQTWSVGTAASAGASGERIDSLAFWNEKFSGISGNPRREFF